MKKFLSLAFILVTCMNLQAQTADAVIQQYITAVGGMEKLNKISSLQYMQTMNLTTPMGEMQVPMTYFKVKDKLFRLNVTTEFTGTSFTVITDTSGWIMIPGNPFSGSEATLQKLKPEERKASLNQSSCEGFFPELVNYAAKGYSAELEGEGKISGKPSYKVRIKKDKDERLYYIDKKTGLVNSMTIKGAAAAAMSGISSMGMGAGSGRADKMELTLNFSDYKETDGVMFPGTVMIDTPMGLMEAKVTGVKLNKNIDAKWYRPQ